MTRDTRESDLHDAIMNLIRADLETTTDYTTLSDVATFRLVHSIMNNATDDLHNALNFSDDRPFYFSDSVYDEICAPTQTIALCSTVLDHLFEHDTADNHTDLLAAIDDMITSVLIEIDDMIDDDDRLPTSIDELISTIRR